MTIEDKGERGVHQKMTDDGDGIEKKVKETKNHQYCFVML